MDQLIDRAQRTIGTSKTGTYVVKGYVSSSGEVSDIVFQLLPSDGYHTLVKQSLNWAQQYAPAEGEAEALEELKLSWHKTLAGAHDVRVSHEQLTPDKRGFLKSADDENKVVLVHMVKVSATVVRPAPVKEPTGRERGSSQKTLAKERLLSSSPLGSYLPRLNLAPGKFADLTAL